MNRSTPRTLAECRFVTGYSRAEFEARGSVTERIYGVLLAVVIGLLMAAALLHWSMQ